MRRAARWTVGIAGALVALVLVAVLAALVLLQTGWGRSVVKHRVEAALNGFLRGRVEIGSLEGGLLAHAVARDVVVRDPAGQQALRVDRLEARYALLPLLWRTVELSDFEIGGVALDVRRVAGGELNLAAILPASLPDRLPARWTVEVRRAAVRDAALEVTLDGRRWRVDRIHVDATLAVREARLTAAVVSARARWEDHDLAATLRGELELAGDAATLAGLVVEASESRLAIPRASFRTDGSGGSGTAAVTLAAADLARLIGTGWVADVDLTGGFSASGGGKPWQLQASGTVAGAPASVEARGTLAPLAAGGQLRIAAIDAAAVWTGAPRGRVDELLVSATLARGRLGARVQARAVNAAIDIDGGADLLARPIALSPTRVVAQVTGVSRFLGGGLPIGGDLDADLRVAGPIDDLAIDGTVRGRGLTWRDLRAASVAATVAVRGLPAAPSGRVQLDARELRKGEVALGDLSLAAAGERRPDGVTTVEVPALSVRARQLEWRGRAAQVTVAPDGAVSIAGVSLRSAAGAIQASARLGSARSTLDVSLGGLDLARLRRAHFPARPQLRGTVDARVGVVLTGARLRELRAHLQAAGLAGPAGGEPVAVTLDGTLLDRELAGTLTLDGGRSGTVKLDLAARAPTDPLDAAAWRRFEGRDLRRLRLDLAGVSLARLSEALPADLALTGTVRGRVEIGAGLASLDGDLAVLGFTTDLVDQPLAAHLRLGLRDRRLTVAGRVDRRGGGVAEIDLRARLPRRLSDWRSLDLASLHGSRVVLDRLPLAAVPRLTGLEGVVSGEAHLDEHDALTARLTVDGARAQDLAVAIDAQIDASLAADRLSARLTSRLGGVQLVDADVTLAAGLRALARWDLDALRGAPVSGQARIAALPLAPVGEMLGLAAPLSGALDAHAALTGSIAVPDVRFEASLARASLGQVTFERLAASGRLDARTLSGTLSAVERGGGTFEAAVAIDLRDAQRARVSLRAVRFDLAFLAILQPSGLGLRAGLLDADLELDGSLARPAARGSARITAGELRVTGALGELHGAEVALTLADGGVTVALRSGVGARGKVTLDATARLDGLSLGRCTGSFRAEAVRMDAEGMRADVSAAGTMTGAPRGDRYALAVTLDSAAVSLPDAGGDRLHPTGLPKDVVLVGHEAAVRPAAATPLLLDVHLETSHPIALSGEGLRAELTANLDVTMGHATVVRGRLTVARGFFNLFGRHWLLAPSHIVFGGETPIDPRLSLHLAYEFQATTVHIGVTGTLRRPELELSSSSDEYEEAQLLGFVLGGSPDDSRPSPDGDLARDAVGAASGQLFGQLQPLVNRLVRFDVISMRQESTGMESTRSTLLTLGKWFTTDIFVAYRHRFIGENETTQNTDEGLLQYFFRRGWRADVVFGDAGNGSADLLWVKRW